jgi:hypothetical protein
MIVGSELKNVWKEVGMAQFIVPTQKDGLPGREPNQGRPECKSETLLSRLTKCPNVTESFFHRGEMAKEVLQTASILSLVEVKEYVGLTPLPHSSSFLNTPRHGVVRC